MTPIEKAARQLCLIDDVDPDSSLGGDGQNFLWMGYAELKVKPILRAIREPSEGMLRAAAVVDLDLPPEVPAGGKAHWTAMIDAALEDG